MAGYVHRDARARARAEETPLTPEREQQLAEEAQMWILEHRQRIKAGVPGCTCGTDFDSYATWEADHALHLAGQLVGPIARHLLIPAEQVRPRELVHSG